MVYSLEAMSAFISALLRYPEEPEIAAGVPYTRLGSRVAGRVPVASDILALRPSAAKRHEHVDRRLLKSETSVSDRFC